MNFWQNKKVLITGITGFKGSWLALWLTKKGARVTGYALPAETENSLFQLAKIDNAVDTVHGNICDYDNFSQMLETVKPEIVFHLAAQAIVLEGYSDPVETFATNVMGTVQVLEAIRQQRGIKAFINVTSDKCYKNVEMVWGYRENDALGGSDPYSCSKSCVELINDCYSQSYFKKTEIKSASVRAGNVIGGGDFGKYRIIPDIITAIQKKQAMQIRNPMAIRPWQHVLEPLSGYMMLAERLYEEGEKWAEPWNFGPDNSSCITVEEIFLKLTHAIGSRPELLLLDNASEKESSILKLDNSKAKHILGWQPVLDIESCIQWTGDWYRAWLEKQNIINLLMTQIDQFEYLAGENNAF